MTLDVQTIRAKFEAANQGHVFTFYDKLSAEQQQKLLAQLDKIDVEEVNNLYHRAINATHEDCVETIKPLPSTAFDSVLTASKEKIQQWETKGLEVVAQNKVAVLLLAGGQGSRLGSPDPKGCYNIGLYSGKSLFQLQAERILKLELLAKESSKVADVTIPWYIMTSGPTRSATETFFKSNNYFGLDAKNVIFFNQGVLPCLTKEGKIILEDQHLVSVAPDGNGGIYPALRKEGIIEDMAKRGVEFIHSYCVDNCLVRVADPVFIGYSVSKNAECGAKVVPKAFPTESVGVICVKKDKFSVVEYSEINEEMAHLTNSDGTLVFGAGNICNHFYTLGFLKRMKEIEQQLEYHIASKKIKYIDLASGEKVAPTTPNGIKLEAFVFDVFPFTNQFAVLEVERKEEFSPLKNAPGSKADCPETSRRDVVAQHIRFIEAAGGKVNYDTTDFTDVKFELSPLVSYSGEGLSQYVQGKTINLPAYIDSIETLKSSLH